MGISLIDTHAHLDDPRFAADRGEVIQRARAAGVERIICIATTAATSVICVDLARIHPQLAATVGIQPNHVAEEPANAWDEVERLAALAGVVALGETGLDRYWDHTPFPMQEDFFARHLELARKLDLPVVIHCREAEADVVRMLRSEFDRHRPIRGVMHSFTGDLATAQVCLEMGLYISFAGMLTYKNAGDLREVARAIPLDRVLVETDSPYLAPVPVRGQRNEPAHVVHTAACLAGLHLLSVEELARHTTENAIRLFRLKLTQ